MSLLLSACDRPAPTASTLAAPERASVGLTASAPLTEPSRLAADGLTLALASASDGPTFTGYTRFPAETRFFQAQANNTAYTRDWFVGGTTYRVASEDGETLRALAKRPDGVDLQWSTVTFRSTLMDASGTELRDCWISDAWRQCGSKAISVHWYAQAQCIASGNWSMSFLHNGNEFHRGEFKVLPQLEEGRVPRLSQTDSRWRQVNYANRCRVSGQNRHDCDGRAGEVQQTIGQLGCNLVSVAMVLNYHGVMVDPPSLNSWLIENGGYSAGNLDPLYIPLFAKQYANVNIRYLGRAEGPDYARFEANLCRYGPQVIAVWGSGVSKSRNPQPTGHFVTATGRDEQKSTVLINEAANGTAGTLAANAWYENTFGGIRLYGGPEHTWTDDLSGMTFNLHSPAHILVTDPAGRRTGIDATGRRFSEIPSASYAVEALDDVESGEADPDPTKEFVLARAPAGDYLVEVSGTGEGTYRLDLRTLSRSGAPAIHRYEDIPTAPGVIHSYLLGYDPNTPGSAPVTGGFDGGGQRSSVDMFLSYSSPSERQTSLPAGTTSYTVMIFYGSSIDPSSFTAELERTDVSSRFNPRPGGMDVVTLPLLPGRNVLVLSVSGMDRGRTARDTDRLTFVVK